MPASLPRGLTAAQRQLAADRRSPANPYAHEDAMATLLGRDPEAIGRALGLAGRTVRQWRERHDSDHRGPGRTLAIAIREALVLGRPASECAEVVRAILEDAGLPFALAPLVRVEGVVGSRDVDHAALAAVRETADAASRASDLCRGGLTASERIEAKREVREALESLAALDLLIDRVPTEVA